VRGKCCRGNSFRQIAQSDRLTLILFRRPAERYKIRPFSSDPSNPPSDPPTPPHSLVFGPDIPANCRQTAQFTRHLTRSPAPEHPRPKKWSTQLSDLGYKRALGRSSNGERRNRHNRTMELTNFGRATAGVKFLESLFAAIE
jgi:hypothetical protein